MNDQREPTDAEIVGGDFQPYSSHPTSDLPAPTTSAVAPAPVSPSTPAHAEKPDSVAGTQQFILGIVSLGTGIPISAIGSQAVEPGLIGLAVAWAGIIGVNVAHAWARRRNRD